MIQPRNTLVVLRLITKSTRRVGQITVPTGNDLYTEAEVMAVGPGNVSAAGGRSETFDLAVGQLVFLKHKSDSPRGKIDQFVPYVHDGKTFAMVEQTQVLGILAEPGKWTAEADEPAKSLILHA
jgi:co-chaperonin GroES (HSP10)